MKLVRASEEDKIRRLIASPAFARANIFDDDLAAIQVHKSRLVLNRPVYVGMSILDLSKSLMYDFYYNRMKAQHGDRCQLIYTDTDSLLLEIQTEDVLSGHCGARASLRHVRLSEGPPPLQHGKQKSSRKDERRVRRGAPSPSTWACAPRCILS